MHERKKDRAVPHGTSTPSLSAVGSYPQARGSVTVSHCAGGESGGPKSPHFNDQAKRYSTGDLREVYFYRDQLKGHTEREYHP